MGWRSASAVRFTVARRGLEAKLVIASSGAEPPKRDPQLCRLVATARRGFEQLSSGEVPSVRVIYETEVTRVLPLAFLALDIVEAIIEGRQPEGLTAERLKRLSPLPSDWDVQRRRLGFHH